MSGTLRIADPFVFGLQLGGIRSPAALAIVERIPGATETARCQHDVRHLERWKPGTPYTIVVQDVAEILSEPLPETYFNRDPFGQALRTNLKGQTAALVVNATGVGKAALELLDSYELGIRIAAAWVTTGDQALETGEGWRVPQRDLVAAVEVLMVQNRLGYEGVELSAELTAQLEAFKVVPGAGGRDRYASEGDEDLVLAAALACWWSELVAPARVELEPAPFNAFGREAREYEMKRRRIHTQPAKKTGPLADSIG